MKAELMSLSRRPARRFWGWGAADAVLDAREQAVVDILDWAARSNIAVIPFGGGTSVCGGVEPAVGDGFAGAISLDMERLGGVLEIDPISRAARIQAGAFGPDIESQLRPHGLTLRHFPQSFGWLFPSGAIQIPTNSQPECQVSGRQIHYL